MRPNASQWVWMGPNTSESLEQLAKTSKNFAKTSKKLRENVRKNIFHSTILSGLSKRKFEHTRAFLISSKKATLKIDRCEQAQITEACPALTLVSKTQPSSDQAAQVAK